MATNKNKKKAGKSASKAKPARGVKAKKAVKTKKSAVKATARKATPKTSAKLKASVKPKKLVAPKKAAADKAKTAAKAAAPSKAPALAKILTPLDDRMLVSVAEPATTTAGGILIPGSVAQRPNRGKVLAVGRGRRNKKGHVRPLDVSVGDYVLFPEYAGTPITWQGAELLILREEEVLGIEA